MFNEQTSAANIASTCYYRIYRFHQLCSWKLVAIPKDHAFLMQHLTEVGTVILCKYE